MTDIEVISLWPSLFLEADLPDHEAHTRALMDLSRSRPDAGVFALDAPGVDWLKQQIAYAVGIYLRRAGHTGAPEWGARGWFDIQEPDAYRGLANEPGAYLSGMYVIRWPTEQARGGRRDDALPGCVSFYDPRAGMNMGAIKRDPYYRYHHSMQPRPGLLSLWPAHVSFFVHPNWSGEATLSVRFGVQVHERAEQRP